MKQEIQHILWDWNGTLLDDVHACVDALNGILGPRGLGPVSIDQYLRQFRFPVYDFYLELGFDFGRDEWEAVSVEYHEYYVQASSLAPLREGAQAALDTFRKMGIGMSIISASENGVLKRMVEERGITDCFQGLYGLTNYHADSKIALGRKFIADSGIAASRILFIGDTLHDLEVATEIGSRCLLAAGGHQSEERLAASGCDIVRDISETIGYVSNSS